MLKRRLFILLECVLVLLFIRPQLSDGLRILGIVPFQMRSHFVMCEELCKALAAKGHQVDVHSHFPQKKPIKNYRDFSLQGTLPSFSNNVSFEEVANTGALELMGKWWEGIQEPMCNLLGHPHFQKLLHNPPNDPPYDLFINEFSLVHCFVPFGRRLNVPVIAIVTPPLMDWHFGGFDTPINVATAPSMFSPYAVPMTFFERLGNFILHEHVVRGYMQYTWPQNKIIEKYFGPGLPNVYDLQRNVSLVLVNHDTSLSGMTPFAPKVIPVGGLHVVDHNDTLPKLLKIQQWLDESKHGCVYMSFGSFTRIETFPKHVIHAFYKSFNNIAPVRVLLKIAKPEDLPPGLPSNVLVQNWFHQVAVLKHRNTKAFVTHGGLMGGQESIHFEVPLIGVPLFGEQFFNVNNYVQRNVAVRVHLHEITESTFTNALNTVLKNPKYRESVQKLNRKMKDRPLTVMDTAIFWVEYVHRHGKDALRSPSDNLLWWQKSLLDVFIGAVIILVSYIIYKLICKVILSIKLYNRINVKLKDQ